MPNIQEGQKIWIRNMRLLRGKLESPKVRDNTFIWRYEGTDQIDKLASFLEVKIDALLFKQYFSPLGGHLWKTKFDNFENYLTPEFQELQHWLGYI